jgi:hypothetical protein
LAAITLSKFVGKNVEDMFADLMLWAGPQSIVNPEAATTREQTAANSNVLAL